MIALCLMWCIWRKRNDQNFEDCEKMMAELNFEVSLAPKLTNVLNLSHQ